jgi:uncharacterized protein (TIGR02217 family)
MDIDAVEFPLMAQRLGPSVEVAATILTNFTGNDTVNPNRSQYRRVYNAAFGIRELIDLRILSTFFHAMGGPVTGFLVKDWTDYDTTKDPTVLVTTPCHVSTQGVATETDTPGVWQLQKKYTVEARSHLRTLKRPKAGGRIYFDDVLATNVTNYTYDTTTGLLTVVSGAPTVITHTLEFVVPCRFAQKNLPADLILYLLEQVEGENDFDGLSDIAQVPMIEV